MYLLIIINNTVVYVTKKGGAPPAEVKEYVSSSMLLFNDTKEGKHIFAMNQLEIVIKGLSYMIYLSKFDVICRINWRKLLKR